MADPEGRTRQPEGNPDVAMAEQVIDERSRPAPTLLTYGRFVRVSHTLFSLPLVFAGLLIGAGGWPPLRVILLGVAAALGARIAAMSLNRIIDRAIDARNPQTAGRELPSGQLTLAEAWGVTALGVVVYLSAAAALAPLLLALAPIPLVVFAGYPYLKRFTPLCHFGVGLALALSPLGGWIAVTRSFHGLLDVLPLAIFGLCWVAGFDVIYATLDEDFDRGHGVHSLPAALGAARALKLSAALHVLAFLALVALVLENRWSSLCLAPLALTGMLLYLEQRQSRNVDLAFFRINIGVGFAVLLLVACGVFRG